MRLIKLIRRMRAVVVLPMLVAVAIPASASACEGFLGHEAAIYANSNGTGFIKNKYPGEEITGPGYPYEYWFSGSVAPYIKVHVADRPDGYMDFNDLETTDCYDPW